MNQHTPPDECTRILVTDALRYAKGRWLTIDEILAELATFRSRQSVRPRVNDLVAQGTVVSRVRHRARGRYEYTWVAQ